METNVKLTKFRRMASSVLLKTLGNEDNEENRDIILKILQQRDVEIPVNSLPDISIEEINETIDYICEFGSNDLKNKIGEILENVEDYSDLTPEQRNQIKNLKEKHSSENKRKTKSLKSSEEKQEKKSLKTANTKEEKIIKFKFKGEEMNGKYIKKFKCRGTTYYKVVIDGINRDISEKNII